MNKQAQIQELFKRISKIVTFSIFYHCVLLLLKWRKCATLCSCWFELFLVSITCKHIFITLLRSFLFLQSVNKHNGSDSKVWNQATTSVLFLTEILFLLTDELTGINSSFWFFQTLQTCRNSSQHRLNFWSHCISLQVKDSLWSKVKVKRSLLSLSLSLWCVGSWRCHWLTACHQ